MYLKYILKITKGEYDKIFTYDILEIINKDVFHEIWFWSY